jgi:hypothetical protein
MVCLVITISSKAYTYTTLPDPEKYIQLLTLLPSQAPNTIESIIEVVATT